MKYKIRLEKTDEGYAVWCPGLPGCWSQGETEEEAFENIKDAIKTYLETIEILNKDKQTRTVKSRFDVMPKLAGNSTPASRKSL